MLTRVHLRSEKKECIVSFVFLHLMQRGNVIHHSVQWILFHQMDRDIDIELIRMI